jgi:thymidylate kinase
MAIAKHPDASFGRLTDVRIDRPPGWRVLIEGPDLSGKSTLVAQLTGELRRRGWTVTAAKGKVCSSPAAQLLSRVKPNRHPHSTLLNAGYLGAALLDHLYLRRPPADTIAITEGYVDRSIAYGIAQRLGLPASVALRHAWLFPTFDLAILLTASLQTRRTRMACRPNPSRIDDLSIQSHFRFLAAYRLVFRRHANRLLIDTSRCTANETLEIALGAVATMVNGASQLGRGDAARDASLIGQPLGE